MIRRNRLNINTPLSVEREFALFHGRDTSPLTRQESGQFIEGLRERLLGTSLHGMNEVVGEVAGNSIELKVCFSSPSRIRGDIKTAYRAVVEQATGSGALVIGTSQPQRFDGDLNYFFTTKMFPDAAVLAGANSIHLHVGAESFEEMNVRYNTLNRAAPLMLAVSQSSVIEGKVHGRARLLNRFMSTVPESMSRPWSITSMEGFDAGMELARAQTEERLRRLPIERVRQLASDYPDYVSFEGGVPTLSRLTPDKIFHLARMRPDKSHEGRKLVGSVEFRPIDGQARMEHDLGMIEMSIGLAAYNESRDGMVLNPSEISALMQVVNSIPENGIMAAGGIDVVRSQMILAAAGLREIGMEPEYLGAVMDVVTRRPQTSVPVHELIQALSDEFAQSVR